VAYFSTVATGRVFNRRQHLTGRPPYDTRDLPALMAAHLTAPIPRPSQNRPQILAGFDDVIERGMAKNSRDRYASAGELAAAGHHALIKPDQDRAHTILASTQVARSRDDAQASTAAKPPSSSRTNKRLPTKPRPSSLTNSRQAAESPTKSPTKRQSPSAKPPVSATSKSPPSVPVVPKHHRGEFTGELFAVSVIIVAFTASLILLIAYLSGAI